MVAGSLYYRQDREKRKEIEELQKQKDHALKRERWLVELEARDAEDRAARDKLLKMKEKRAAREEAIKKKRAQKEGKELADAEKENGKEPADAEKAEETSEPVPSRTEGGKTS